MTSHQEEAGVSGFTPGPWRISRIASTAVENSAGRSVCSTGGYHQSWDTERVAAENAANARLIAAAPDLIDALIWIAQMAEVRAADDKQVFTRVNRGALRNIAARARSALSRALRDGEDAL